MTDCYYCAAKNTCLSAVSPGSVACLVNKLQSGATKGEELPPRQKGEFCQFCGRHLKQIGGQRFCNNPSCKNRFVDC